MQVTIEANLGYFLVTLHDGNRDAAVSLQELFDKHLSLIQGKNATVLVDLSNVAFPSSDVLSLLARLRAGSSKLVVIANRQITLAVLQVSSLDRFFEIADSLESALELLQVERTHPPPARSIALKRRVIPSPSLDPSLDDPASIDRVRFSAFCEPVQVRGASFLLEVFAYLPDQRESVLSLGLRDMKVREVGTKGPVNIGRDSTVTVLLDFPKFEVDEPIQTIEWTGEIANTQFVISVPENLRKGKYFGKARVFVAGLQICTLKFSVTVGKEGKKRKKEAVADSVHIRKVFASYASEDRLEVLRFKRAAETLGAEVFVDVLSLRNGENWASRLQKEIPNQDLFCLFWSQAASKSEWVTKEWQAALSSRGCDFIQPIPLCDPRDVPPPSDLRRCAHFEDLNRIAIAYESIWRSIAE